MRQKRVRLRLTDERLIPHWQLKLGNGYEIGLLTLIFLPDHRKAGALRCEMCFVWTFCCEEDNDLFRVMRANGLNCSRYDTPAEAVAAAMIGSATLILDDGYPSQPRAIEQTVFDAAARKKLKLYVEYPEFLPGTKIGQPTRTQWERAIVVSDAFAPDLAKLRILAIHDCHFLPVTAEHSHIVVGRVARFDTAVYGLPTETFPILFNLPKQEQVGQVLVSTTKLSCFVTARYAPTDAWRTIWKQVLTKLHPESEVSELVWTASVRPSFRHDENLPADIERQALQRGIDWLFNSPMMLHASNEEKYLRRSNGPYPASANPDLKQDWPFGHRVGTHPTSDHLNFHKAPSATRDFY